MKVLVIDDEEDTPLLFKHEFRKEIKQGKLEFHFVYCAETALDFLKSPESTEVILILSDINMPGLNGIELLKIIKEQYSNLIVFMITAYGDDNNYKKSIEYGADKFITKPIDFSDLRQEIINLK